MTQDLRTHELNRSRVLRDLAWRCDDEHEAKALRQEADAILASLELSQKANEYPSPAGNPIHLDRRQAINVCEAHHGSGTHHHSAQICR